MTIIYRNSRFEIVKIIIKVTKIIGLSIGKINLKLF